MAYLIVSAIDAKRYIVPKLSGSSAAVDLHVQERGLGEDFPWESMVSDLRIVLTKHQEAIGGALHKESDGGRFEAMVAQDVHRVIPRNHPAVSDPEFWIWLSVAHFDDVIVWRYSSSRKEGHNLANYGIGNSKENLLYRLWMRAELVYESGAPDPYYLSTLGDVDFWRSHLFRQEYAAARKFARTFLRFQFPGGKGSKPTLSNIKVRALAKRLKRAKVNLIVDTMEDTDALKFIESEWEKLESQTL